MRKSLIKSMLLLFLVVFMVQGVAAQEFRKIKIEGNEIISRNFGRKTELMKSNRSLFRSAFKDARIQDNENYFAESEGVLYTKEYIHDGIKMRKHGKRAVLEKTFPAEGVLKSTSKIGHFVYLDYAHGEGSEYTFFNSNLEKTQTYQPFKSGFQFTASDYNDSQVVIYSRENTSSKSKIALLSLDGELLGQRSYSHMGFTLVNVKVDNDIIACLFSSNSSASSKVVVFNSNLDFLWERTFNERSVNNDLRLDKLGRIYFTTPTKLNMLDASQGNLIYSHYININVGHIILDYSITQEDYLVVVSGIPSEESAQLKSVILSAFSENNIRVFDENIGDTNVSPRIYQDNNSFYLSIRGEFFKYLKN